MITATQQFAQPQKDDLPTVYPKGRRCVVCAGFLSMYNPGSACWCHGGNGEDILIQTSNGWQRFPLTKLISRQKLSELVPNRG